MKAMKLVLDDKAVYLRLSASKLAEYAKEIGSGGNTLFAVMDALDDLEKQAALFTAALTYKGNPNEIHDGFGLIDMLADAGYSPVGVKKMIIELAVTAGVISNGDALRVVSAIQAGSDKLYDAAVAVLSGDLPDLPAAKQEAEEPVENPT